MRWVLRDAGPDSSGVCIGQHEQMQGTVLARVTPPGGLFRRDVLDLLGQGRPTEILVLQVDELGGVVHRLHVHALDIAHTGLRLGSQQLRQLLRSLVAFEFPGQFLRRPQTQQFLTGLHEPGVGEVMMKVLQDRPGQPTGNVLARRLATRPAIGRRLALCRPVAGGMPIGIPVLIEHVVPHDETDGDLRLLIIDQYGLLVVGHGGRHHALGFQTELPVQGILVDVPENPVAFRRRESTADEQRNPSVGHRRCFLIANRTISEPLSIVGILLFGRTLQSLVLDTQIALAGQVRLPAGTCTVERKLPTQDAYPHPFPGFASEQLAYAGGVAVADEIHRRLKAPTADINRFPGLGNGLVHGPERLFAVDQGLEGCLDRVVFGVLHEPWRGAPGLVGVLEADRNDDWLLGHRFSPCVSFGPFSNSA